MNPENIAITNIKSIKLYPQDDDEIRRTTNIIIKNSQTFKEGLPDIDGLHDARMGTTDHSWTCKTCYNRKNICPGHSGRIELNYPVPNPHMLTLIPKWLRVICHLCGSLLVETVPAASKQSILKELESAIWKDRSAKKCFKCGNHTHYTLYKPKENKIEFLLDKSTDDTSKNAITKIHYHQIDDIFNKITLETISKLKFPVETHPKHIMLHCIDVVANTNRQDIKKPGSTRSSSDDLTIFLKYIVEINNNIRSIPKPIDQTFENTIFNLTMQVYGYFKGSKGNQIKNVSIKATGGRAMMGCINGFKGKQGLLRSHLLGKRTHHSARAVITGDININITEVGIPEYIARTLYIEETVTEYNIDRLQLYVYNGTSTYPGSSKIIKHNTKNEYSPDISKDAILNIGDIVYRDIIDGDPIHINRSPSLKTTSIMAFNAVVSRNPNSKVIRINPAICSIFDADFDGDAMQLFLCSSVSSRAETQIIMSIYRNTISTRDNTPNFGMFYDSTLGTFLMTRSEVILNKYHAMCMFDQILDSKNLSYMDMELFSDSKYGFRDLTTKLIPDGFNYEKTLASYNSATAPYIKYKEEDIRLRIVNGVHISGMIDHKSMGQNVSNSIIHIVNNQFSGARAIKMIYDFQKIARNYIQFTGFSLGISDYHLPQKALDEMHDTTSLMIYESERLTAQLDNGDIVAPPDKTIAQHFEDLQINACKINLDSYLHIVMKYVDINKNNVALIINGGSKGSVKDLIHASGTIGQQIINGRRLPKNFDFERSSPYYQKWDMNPLSRGLVTNGYLTGTNLFEFISLAISARHELTNTALNTAQGGEQGRLSGSILGAISIDNYRRSSKDTIVIQYIYGGTGWDIKYLENTKIPSIIMSLSDVKDAFYIDKPEKVFPKINKSTLKQLLDEEYAQIIEDRDTYRQVYLDMERCVDGFVLTDDIKLPVNVYRIVIDVQNNYSSKFKSPKYTLDPVRTIKRVKQLIEDIPYLLYNLQMKGNIQLGKHVAATTGIVNMLVRINLCVKNLLKRGITDPTLDIIINNIMIKFSKVPIQYGTPVGLIASQAISSIMTQYIIDSKHRSGAGGSSSGVVRLKDIFRGTPTDKMKTPPTTLLRLIPEYRNNKYMAELIANHIEMIPLNRFINEYQIFFEEYGHPTHPNYIKEKIIMHTFDKYRSSSKPINLTRWCIRMELNKAAMLLKNVNLEDIIISVKKLFPSLYLVYTAENVSPDYLKQAGITHKDVIILRCYVKSSAFEKTKYDVLNTVIQLKNDLLSSIIRGVNGIVSAKPAEVPVTVFQEDGSTKINKEFKIKTIGTNVPKLMEISYLQRDSIVTSSIIETMEIYGIEAAREMILNELYTALNGISRSHFTLYGDEMTYTGTVTSVEKLGVTKREPNNFLHQMSIKHPMYTLENAINNTTTSKIYGVAPSLLMGCTSKTIGTAYNRLILDREFVNKHTKKLEDIIDDL